MPTKKESAPLPTASAAPTIVRSAQSQLQLSTDTAQRISDVCSSEHKSVSPRHTDSIVYGDEVISVEDELKYPYTREQQALFLTGAGAGAKGPLFNRNTHPQFFQQSPYNGPRTSESPRFWTQEHAIFYSWILYDC